MADQKKVIDFDKEMDGFSEVTQTEKTEMWDYQNDPIIEGVYQGVKSNVGPNKSNVYTLMKHGELVGIWGTSVLDTQFVQIPVGHVVKLCYLGKVKNPATGRSYHGFRIGSKENK